MKHALLAVLLLGCAARADTILRNGGTVVGPVTSLDCPADAGIFCARTTGTTIGRLTCAVAGQTTPGCVSTGSQTFSGAKLFDGGVVVNGPAYVDGGFTVNGPVLLDGGVRVNGSLWVDGGITTYATIVSGTSVKATNGIFTGATGDDGGVPRLSMIGTDVAYLATTGLIFRAGVSIPQVGFGPAAYSAGGAGTGAFRKVVSGTRFTGPAQLTRLAGTVNQAGVSDGGLGADAGVSQVWFIEVYNLTTGATLCDSALKSCALTPGLFSSACGVDAGGYIAIADDIQLTIHDEDCLVAPAVNFNFEYAGLP